MRTLSLLFAVLLLGLGLAACNDNAYDDDVTGDDDADDDSAVGDDDDDLDDDDSAGAQPHIFVDPHVLAYGSVCVGSAAMLPVAIANLGEAPLVIDAMQCPLTEVSFTPFSGPIPPAAQPVSVDITVSCSVAGPLAGPLKIISNDPDRPMYNVPVEASCDGC